MADIRDTQHDEDVAPEEKQMGSSTKQFCRGVIKTLTTRW